MFKRKKRALSRTKTPSALSRPKYSLIKDEVTEENEFIPKRVVSSLPLKEPIIVVGDGENLGGDVIVDIERECYEEVPEIGTGEEDYWDVPQVTDVYSFANDDSYGYLPEDERRWNENGSENEPSLPLKNLFEISNPISRDSMGVIIEKKEDYEMVMVGTGVNRGLKRKKKKKPEKQIIKLTPKPTSDSSQRRELHRALSFQSGHAKGPLHPTGRRTLAGVHGVSNYDTMEFPQDDSFSYSRPSAITMVEKEQQQRNQEEKSKVKLASDDGMWSSSSGEDVEEVIHRIAHGKGSVSALMPDGSEPTGIFVGMSEDELRSYSLSPEFLDEGEFLEEKRKKKTSKKVSTKKGKRGRKSEGLDIRRIPFVGVALAEDLMKQIQSYKEFPGLGIETPDSSEKGRTSFPKTDTSEYSKQLMIQQDPIRSEMMLTTNYRDGGSEKELSKGIPVVSPLTRLKQMFIKASRLPEEAAVLARAKELDEIQASIRFGKLNDSSVHVNSNIQDYVYSGKVVVVPHQEKYDEKYDEDYSCDYYDEEIPKEHFSVDEKTHEPSIVLSHNTEYDEGDDKRYAVLSLKVDTQSDQYLEDTHDEVDDQHINTVPSSNGEQIPRREKEKEREKE
ncbi:MAG: hypothetical protein ACTSUE_07405, partial [Promethearchaeota archaeon]